MPTSPFETVWNWVRRVPAGKVVSYGQISKLMRGRLSAAAVGWAMRGAPPDVPWHRVVNSRGALSTDRERPGLQRRLLEQEGIRFDDADTLDLARHAWRGPTRTKKAR